MLQVDVDKIIPVTEARDSFNKIIDEVDNTDQMYVLTRNGTPAAVVVGVNHLEKLTGDAVLPAAMPEPKPDEKKDDVKDDLVPVKPEPIKHTEPDETKPETPAPKIDDLTPTDTPTDNRQPTTNLSMNRPPLRPMIFSPISTTIPPPYRPLPASPSRYSMAMSLRLPLSLLQTNHP